MFFMYFSDFFIELAKKQCYNMFKLNKKFIKERKVLLC